MKIAMKNFLLALFALFLLLPSGGSHAAEDGFVLINSPYPPYVMPQGHPLGPGIDMEIAMRVLERLGIRPQVRLEPFKRVLAMLEQGSADMTTSLSFREDRDRYLLWSMPYRKDTAYVFYTRKDSTFIPRSLEDLRGKTVGMARGFVFPEAFMQDTAIAKDEAPHMQSLAAMLLEGRFDAIIVNSMAGSYELMATGRMNEIRRAPFSISTPGDAGTFMGFSRARVHREFVQRFNAEIERLKSDGVIEQIEGKYLQ
jgi:ABC-type amino acid transport substrate-binding protein